MTTAARALPPRLTYAEEQHLARTIALAREAAAFASPNPTVGCVLTSAEGRVLGEGAHRYAVRDHAEIVALHHAAEQGHSVRGTTAYVSLEPCSTHGRTGPCADALLAAGIGRCIVATLDPNPQVQGRGIARLRAGGVAVDLLPADAPLAVEARRLNDAFACFIRRRRPFVTLKAALSVDGRLAPPPATRSSISPHWLTGGAARADAQQLRHSSDALLTGIGTVLADDPSLTDRTGLPRRRPLLRIVLDTRLRTPLGSKLLQTASEDLLLVVGPDVTAARVAEFTARGCEVLQLPQQHNGLDLQALFAALVARQVLSVLVEAGSALNGSLLAAGLVDKLVLYYAEAELGADALPFADGVGSPYELQQRLLQVTRVTFPSDLAPGTEDVRISGFLRDPWGDLP